MNKTLEKAIIKTYQKYGFEQARKAIIEAIKNGNIMGFTNDDNARTELDIRKPEEFKKEIIEEYLRCVLKVNSNEKGSKDFLLDGIGNLNTNIEDWMLDTISKRVTEEIIKENPSKTNMTPQNIKVYNKNINQLKATMISGLTYNKEGSIEIANMQAATTKGNVRKNQEDAVLLMVHPENSNFKMMVVSDGMGGHDFGEEASHITIEQMKDWFFKIPSSYYKNVRNLQNMLNSKLNDITKDLYDRYSGNGGSTFVGAIVGEDETLLSNIGDSRGYILKGKELIPITRDQSMVQVLYDIGDIKERDDMRFHNDSNKITQCLGNEDIAPQFYITNNKDYDMLFLFSDGVTDCLSDNNLLAITKNTDKKQLASKILENALSNESIARKEISTNPNYQQIIPPGKDNATVSILFNDDEFER